MALGGVTRQEGGETRETRKGMGILNRGSRFVHVFALIMALLSANGFAQARPPTDAALGALIEDLTSRRSDDLFPEKLLDGSLSLDLKGRFQQVPLARFIGDDLAMVQCVSSVEEADVFFGRDLRSGAPLSPKAEEAHAALVEEALRHGMSVPEYQFYQQLIEQAYPAPLASSGSTITIVNNDGPGEGFNSTAPQFLPAPGNDSNANLGQQRLALFNAAAEIWGSFLDSTVAIEVQAQFDPLSPCNSSGGVLGAAGTLTLHANFSNAEFTNTYYHAALANKRAGADLSASNPDINATFNSSIDSGCLGSGSHFYYGLDNATPAGTVNLFVVLLHEMGHGLGSSSFTNGTNGTFLGGIPDIWARFLYDSTVGLRWNQMTNAQRAASAVNTNRLFWDGANVRNASAFLSSGRDATTGRVQMYAPNPYQGGSSVSHYSNVAFPNLLMEPSINSGLPLTLDLTRQQMRDIGWYRNSSNNLVPDTITNVSPSGGALEVGAAQDITWTNNGGFSNNVTIELSLDGGSTYPIVVASDLANSGSYAWVVPNSPSTQARLRVREHDFLTPLGQSASTVVIGGGSNTAPSFTPAGALSRQQGTPAGAAVLVGTVSDGQTPAGDLVVTQVAGGTAGGISLGSISNSGGTVTATLAAACDATSGTVRVEGSDGGLTGNGDLQVNVSANPAPVLGYANQAVDGGGGTTVNPVAGPADNGVVLSIAVQDMGTYGGGISVDAAGVVSISNAQPIGTHTITIRATDNCGVSTDATFQLSVDNTAPSFTPAGALSRQQGSPAGAAVVVGTVSDEQTPAGQLTVTQVAGGTAGGITVGSISNSGGTVTATLAAACDATSGTVRFEVFDGSLTGNGDLQVNVSANPAPVLGYANQAVDGGGSVVVNPTAGPADNGDVQSIVVQNVGTYGGSISVDAAGAVSISNAHPNGTHTITIRATDNCGAVTDATFQLGVDNTPPGFTPADIPSLQQGSPAGAAVAVGTVSDEQTPAGQLAVTAVDGGTASGISIGSISNSNGTVTATLAAGCEATSGSVRFEVSDGTLTGSGDLQLNVNVNTPPTIGEYPGTQVGSGQAVMILPGEPPGDNGSVDSIGASVVPDSFTGSLSVDPVTGEISVGQAAPVGAYTITVTVTDNCGATADREVVLDVLGAGIFSDGFEEL